MVGGCTCLISGGWQPPNTSAHALVDSSKVWLCGSRFTQAFGNNWTLAAAPIDRTEPATGLIGSCSQRGPPVRSSEEKKNKAHFNCFHRRQQLRAKNHFIAYGGREEGKRKREWGYFFFTAKVQWFLSFLPFPLKGTKIHRKRIQQIFILLVRKDGAAKAASSL